jgi:hypothetical protein
MASFNTINFENNKIFVIIDNSNIFWFNAKQICKSLNYVDTKQVISNSIEKEDKVQLKNMNSTKITFEKLKTMVDLIIFNNLNIEILKTNKDLSIQIIQIINEIKIIDNNLAYVEESKKTYKRFNTEWCIFCKWILGIPIHSYIKH